jgi:cytidylate kinase
VLEDIKTRDHNDSTRKTAPAIPADDAVMLDNSALDIEGTVNAVIDIIKSKVEL